MKDKVLVLGAGLVSRPLVRYLLKHDIRVTVATRTVSKANALLDGHPLGTAVPLDLTEAAGLDALIAAADVVVSLVPYAHHVAVARRCLALGKPMATTSYVSNEMRDLDGEARKKGLLIVNELGVDPGIDHMSAMRVIDGVEKKGGRITFFRSCCGGLPAADANDNPWGYKFSWSPKGVLLAGRNAARFMDKGKVIEVEPNDLFRNHWPTDVQGVGPMEYYPNRDSLQYTGLYGLKGVETMFRGTIRYPGWSVAMKGLVDLGWMSLDPPPTGAVTCKDATTAMAGCTSDGLSTADVREKVARKLSMKPDSDALDRYEFAGLFSNELLPDGPTRLEILGELLQPRLKYAKGQRDMIILVHEFEAAYDDGRRERITSSLVDYGIPGGDTAMSRTVSLPCAIAVRLILKDRIKARGVHIPVTPEFYEPVLEELERLDIICKEEATAL